MKASQAKEHIRKFKDLYLVLEARDEVDLDYLWCFKCNHVFRWCEVRLPSYCPECGNKFLAETKK